MRQLIFLLFLFALSASAEEKNYQVFDLGFNPDSKIKMIKDMLSDSGKLYLIRTGSVFVRDDPSVLKAIEKLLNDPQLDRIEQARVSLRRKDQRQLEQTDRNISVEVNPDAWKIQGQFGQNERDQLSNKTQNVLATIGEKAFISLGTTSTQLEHWRRRFLVQTQVQEELEALQVTVLKSSNAYRVKVQSVYRARVEGQWRTFETGQINTLVLCRPGQWLNIGGSVQDNSQKDQSLWGLNRKDTQDNRDLSYEICVENASL
jgi:Fe2+ transport system protein FeoA